MTENQEKCSPLMLKATAFFGTPKPKAPQKSKDCIEQNMEPMNAPHKIENLTSSTKTF